MANGRSIVTDKLVAYQTPPAPARPRVGWFVDRFEALIQSQGYDAYIDHAQRCPCADKNSGQTLSTCKNCLGRGWIFIDRTETRIISQHMDFKLKYENWSEVNRGTASITTRGVNKLGFMDRIILTQLIEDYSEILKPIMFENELVAYPVYEPLSVKSIYLFTNDNEPLYPLQAEDYTIDKNRIVFNQSILNHLSPSSFNVTEMPVSVSILYSHYPVYHVIDIHRDLMSVRSAKPCGGVNDEKLTAMPINVTARVAHFIFDAQRWGAEAFDNTVNPKEEVVIPPFADFAFVIVNEGLVILMDKSEGWNFEQWTIPDSKDIEYDELGNILRATFTSVGDHEVTLRVGKEGFPDSVCSKVVRINLLNI